MSLELIAAAKLNLTLEVLGRRPDGYHEIVSLMQTIDLADTVTLSVADGIELEVTGARAGGVPQDSTRNLAYRAAEALAQASGRSGLGAHIRLEKLIPSGGLGGGSSDAAAVLRGLNRLWGLDLGIDALSEVAASLGSDVTFFLHCGTAVARGRGERIEPLPDTAPLEMTLFVPDVAIDDKTRRMYALLTPDDYSTGHRTQEAVVAARDGALRNDDLLNVFQPHLAHIEGAGQAMQICHDAGVDVLATGAGACFFSLTSLIQLQDGLLRELEGARVGVIPLRSLGRAAATAINEA